MEISLQLANVLGEQAHTLGKAGQSVAENPKPLRGNIMILNWIRYFALCASTANIIAASVLLLVMLFTTPAWSAERDWSLGAGVAADPNGEYTGVIVSGQWLPTTRGFSWGVHTYGMLARYDHNGGSGTSAVLGVAPVLTWKGSFPLRLSIGMGAAVNNTTAALGTPVNFSSVFVADYEVNDSISVTFGAVHLSHGASVGIKEDKPNGGVTAVILQGIYKF